MKFGRLFGMTLGCLVLALPAALGQRLLRGTVVDAASGKPLAFATLKAAGSSQGVVADLDGRFSWSAAPETGALLCSHIGYETATVPIPSGDGPLTLRLQPAGESLGEVSIRPPYEKIRRLLGTAIQRRPDHNPDQLPEYRCAIYYKMAADMDFSPLADDSAEKESLRRMNEEQHLLVAETYSRRYWRRPGSLHEDVVATRFSGLERAAFTNLVTNVLPFHVQGDFIRINEHDYPNPVAKGYESRYRFGLSDEFLEGTDTVWVLQFRPKDGIDGLRGRLFLHSDGYVVSRFEAEAYEKSLGHRNRIEQQYLRTGGRWFPHRLNYVLDWKNPKSGQQTVYIRGTSRIDSVAYALPAGYRFDKAHTSALLPGAETTPDSLWPQYRTDTFTAKDARTYAFDDSLAHSFKTDNLSRLFAGLPVGKLPLGPFDVNLRRLYSYNGYEGTRWGFGLQTADLVSKRFSVGAWAGYGNLDFQWKWGGFAELYAGKYRETIFRIAYDNDLRDPGRVFLHPELDKGYVRQYLIQRADAIRAYSASAESRLGYWNVTVEGRRETIEPKYAYALAQESGGTPAQTFTATEGILRLRYAFGEQTAVAFGHYSIVGSKFPVAYAVLTAGQLGQDVGGQTAYQQLLAAVQWSKHINRIGTERFLLLGGKSWSDNRLPLSKLFAGRGYRYGDLAAYTFGNFYTLNPYDAYTDAFASGHWRHDFDFRLWNLSFSRPSIGLGYGVLWGKLNDAAAQQGPAIFVPERPYQEGGVVLNDLLRLKYLGVAYITAHAGYYLPFGYGAASKSGVAVLGIGITL